MLTESSVIKIVPRVMGAGGSNGILQVVLGVALIVAGFWTGGATTNIGVAMIGAGAGMLVGGIAQMLMPKAETQDQNQDGNRATRALALRSRLSRKVILCRYYAVNEKSADLLHRLGSSQKTLCKN